MDCSLRSDTKPRLGCLEEHSTIGNQFPLMRTSGNSKSLVIKTCLIYESRRRGKPVQMHALIHLEMSPSTSHRVPSSSGTQ